MDTIDLKSIPVGAAIEIIEAGILPVRQTEIVYTYLCIDAHDRVVTTANSMHLYGAFEVNDLMNSLKQLGYAPFVSTLLTPAIWADPLNSWAQDNPAAMAKMAFHGVRLVKGVQDFSKLQGEEDSKMKKPADVNDQGE